MNWIYPRIPAQPHGLIGLLLNPDAREDWVNAAIELGAYDEPEAERALLRLAASPNADEALADSCGESLATIWCRKRFVDPEKLARLTPGARKSAIGKIEALRPELLPKLP